MSTVASNENGLGPRSRRQSTLVPIVRGASTIEPSTGKLDKLASVRTKDAERSATVVRTGGMKAGPSDLRIGAGKASPQRRMGRLPSIMSSTSRNSQPRDVYNLNWQLDVDSRLLSVRQHDTHVHNYYSRVIKNRIFDGNETKMSPMLAKERTIRDMMFTTRKGTLPSMVSTGGPPRKNMMMGTTKKLKDDDSLFTGSEQKESTDKSSRHRSGRKPFNPNTSLLAQQGLITIGSMPTGAETSRLTALMASGSHLMDESLLDPIAGNSVLNLLGQSIHASAMNQLDDIVDTAARKRSRQRRKRELAGPAELSLNSGFAQVGLLEEEMQERLDEKEKATETNTLANSSVYGRLHDPDDVESFLNFYAQTKEEEGESDRPEGRPSARDPYKTSYIKNKNKEALDDPELHYSKFKAKIKLKVVKDYQEDIKRQAEALRKAAEPVLEVKDKWGRVIEKQRLFVTNKRRAPSLNRRPRKRPALRVRKSFAADQKRYADADEMYDPLANLPQPTLTDLITIETMKKYQRWPVPEHLVGRPKGNFRLKVDSLIAEAYREESMQEWANWRPLLDVPYNSMQSADELAILESEDSEEAEERPGSAGAIQDDDEVKLDAKMLEHCPFRMESMKYYPYKSREGEIPLKLLKVAQLDWLPKIGTLIEKQQKAIEHRWTMKTIQKVFDYYCQLNKAVSMPIAKFFDDSDPNNPKFSIKNFKLDENTVKALACLIPFLVDINEVELKNNQMLDSVSGAIVLACFANPSLKRITITYNFMRMSFSRTLQKLIKIFPEKISYFNFMGSLNFADHLMPVVNTISHMRLLMSLNIAGCGANQQSCRAIAQFILASFQIRELDVSHCKINFQGTRYLVDALNRNTTIRNFNFSHNDLSSQSYEFSIKIASIITRHPALMHLNIAATNLRRHEIMFIALSLPTSKVMLSLHLTSSSLPYYERIFLRAVIAARVSFQYRNLVGRKEVKSNKERNQLLQMASGEVQERTMQQYLDVFRDLDAKRQGLDFEIQDLLDELDTTATYEDISPETTTADHFPTDSKVGILIAKMLERQKEIEEQKKKLLSILGSEKDSIKSQTQALAGAAELAALNAKEFGKISEQSQHMTATQEDFFMMQKELKVERQRQRAEQQINKEHQDRSAGELALMFMGINQVAYDLLVENPMTGYMNEVVFTRILGHDDVEQGQFWADGTQCWVCQKWNKVQIAYHLHDDKSMFHQKVYRIQNLHDTVNEIVKQELEHEKKYGVKDRSLEMEVIEIPEFKDPDDSSSITTPGAKKQNQLVDALKRQTETQPTTRADTKGNMNSTIDKFLGMGSSDEIQEQDTEQEDEDADEVVAESKGDLRSETSVEETEVEEVEKPMNHRFDSTSPISPVKRQEKILKHQVYPSAINEMNEFEAMDLRDSYKEMEFTDLKSKMHTSQSAHGSRKQVYVRPLDRLGVPIGSANPQQQNQARALQKQFLSSRHGSSSGGDYAHQTSVISTREHKRKRGEAVKVERVVFFDGMVYQIEEEIYSEEGHSSVYTSEDDFEEDDDLQRMFTRQNPLKVGDNASLITPAMDMTGTSFGGFSKHRKEMLDKIADYPERMTPDGSKSRSFADTVSNPHVNIKDLDDAPSFGDATSGNKTANDGDDGSKSKGKKSKKKKDKDKKSDAATPKASSPSKKKKAAVDDPNQKRRSLIRGPIKKVELFSHSAGLTDQQKDYESKLWPRHYKELTCNARMHKFDELESIMSKSMRRPGGRAEPQMEYAQYNKGGSMIGRDDRTTETCGLKPKEKEVYVVCSFNDWMPRRLKTDRRLNLEKYPVYDEDIPKDVYQLDNTIAIYADMVPPGQHFFYLCQEKGNIFLSPAHEVVRFKKTNVYLNRIVVQSRLEDIDTVHIARDAMDEEAIFMKDRSVFGPYREDTTAFLRKCFEQDMEYAKIGRLYKKSPEMYDKVQETLFSHYVQLCNIFTYYSGKSEYPRISMNDMTSFAHHTGLLDQVNINLAGLDLLLVASNVSTNKYKQSAERDIVRYEFMEFLVRTAVFRYEEKGQAKDSCEAFEKLLKEYIYPNSRQMNGEHFRKYYCYNVKTNEVLKKNEINIEKLYKSFIHPKKKYITLEEAQAFVRKLDIKISEMMVGALYGESMMTVIDNMSDPTRCQQMKYVEFLVFLCRITHEHYESTVHRGELLYVKLDHMLPHFLGHVGLDVIFQFGEKFEAEAKQEYKSYRRKQKKVAKMQAEADANGEKLDPKILLELKEMEKKMRMTGNSFISGQSKLSKKKSDGGQETDLSSDEKKSGNSFGSDRRSLVEQQQSNAVSITRANFGKAMIDHPSGDASEGQKPPAELSDRTNIGGQPWQTLKKMAMEDDYKKQVEYQKLTPQEKENVQRLIDAQRTQGNMSVLEVEETKIGPPNLGARDDEMNRTQPMGGAGGNMNVDEKNADAVTQGDGEHDHRQLQKLEIDSMSDFTVDRK